MSGGTEAEAGRARPLSGGLWTLFSWLRRDEHSSTESVSSAGSDRTAASFAFLAPAHYGCAGSEPATRPPPSPPSDSYRRRVRERSLRRQRDRDLTLHRKYGLYGLGFDGNSLPVAAARRPEERARRANSESPRAHVPGKRRAPPPPAPAATLPRRRARKRPAPLPPSSPRLPPPALAVPDPMDRLPVPDDLASRSRDDPTGCKPEKYSKKDTQPKETKDVKIRHEKSFLKHIFDSKKRNSAIDTSTVKLLPSISELDKQAAEMIEKYRLKEITPNDEPERADGKNDSVSSSTRQQEAWICTRCLKKYDSSVITCNYCLPLNKSNDPSKNSKVSNNCTQTKNKLNSTPGSSNVNIEDKERLKEILKEMKDSLPKRPKSELITSTKTKNNCDTETKEDHPKIVEASTLRIGSSISVDKKPVVQASTSGVVTEQSSSSRNVDKQNSNPLTTINSVIVTQPVVLVHTKENVVSNDNKVNTKHLVQSPVKKTVIESKRDFLNTNVTETGRKNPTDVPKPLNITTKTNNDLNTPLKISSLLNPIYIPKTTSTRNTETKLVKQVDLKDLKNEKNKVCKPQSTPTENIVKVTTPPPLSATAHTPQTKEDLKPIPETKNTLEIIKLAVTEKVQQQINEKKLKNSEVKSDNIIANTSASGPSTSKVDRLDQHARRRDLINKLERSIAQGDEKAAADAAIKLAQLKLSCSVLSFSSQIVGEPTTSQPVTVSKTENNVSKFEIKKVDEVAQKSSVIVPSEKALPSTKQIVENIVKQNIDKNDEKRPTSSAKENVQGMSSPKPYQPKITSAQLKDESKKQTENIKEMPKLVSLKQSEASTSKDGSKAQGDENEILPILIWVEDKEATRGPVQLQLRRGAALGELRREAERALGVVARLQRWIVGRALCADDAAPLAALAGPDLAAPFYLCLVEPEAKIVQKDNVETEVKDDAGNVYNELMKLERQPLVLTAEVFECGVCMEQCAPGGGVVLRECVHCFCRPCLADVVRHCEDAAVGCPATGCRGALQEREVRALLPAAEYERWLARGLAAAESGSRNAFHCRTADCAGWALCEPGVRRFPCPVCSATNCVPCQAIHEGESCEQHRAKLEARASSEADQTDEGTRALLSALIARGEALECPECSAIITKKWGCDWIKCSACKTEICWVTRGRRWGPAGRGDTSAGCRCGVDGKRCHPSCGYCH